MRTTNTVLTAIAFLSIFALTASPAKCGFYMEDFESGLGGWDARPNQAVWKTSGGVGDSGYIEGTRFGLGPIVIPDTGAAEANVTGNLSAIYGNEIEFSYFAKVFTDIANPDAPNVVFWDSGFNTAWTLANIGSSLAPFQSDWTEIAFMIDTSWSDAEANANGWTRVRGSASWSDTVTNVEEMEMVTGIGGHTGNIVLGIDEITVQSATVVPEPGSALLFGIGSLTLLGYRRRRRRETQLSV